MLQKRGYHSQWSKITRPIFFKAKPASDPHNRNFNIIVIQHIVQTVACISIKINHLFFYHVDYSNQNGVLFNKLKNSELNVHYF